MALSLSPRTGKLAYGAFFSLVVPVALWFWSSRLACPFPAVHAPWLGAALLVAGGSLMLLAMLRLWYEGGGLPMNAFPPPCLVTSGVYAWLPHPIYLGFVACCAGVALVSNSAAGLWIVTPVAALGCAAILLGYETPDLRRRFGSRYPAPWLGLPPGAGYLTLPRRLGTALAVFAPWVFSYWAVKAIGVSAGAFETRLNWEWNIPVLPAIMPLYASIYPVAPLTFLLCADCAEMRRLAAGVWLATGLNTLLYATVPATAAFRPVAAHDWMSQWLAWEQHMDLPAAGSFPSFHASWAVICAAFLARSPLRRAAPLCWLWCVGVCISCLTAGMHSVADVLAGALIGALCVNPLNLWKRLLDYTEHLGNTWKAWRIGSLRVINHAVWSGLAGFAVLLIAGMSADANMLGWLALAACCALLGAGMLAQLLEGSSALLRPFGYYGAILGGLLGLALVAGFGGPAADLLGALALAAPWTQAIGRLRCVIQGCCHGHPVDWGIRITNPHSRVAKMAGLIGKPIHPTPLYSILANIITGVILLRLRFAGAGAFPIAGLYLLLAGMSRFIEEAYRGEPQTIRVAGLPIYQWLAVVSLVLGMIQMTLPSHSLPPMHAPTPLLMVASLLWGLVCAFAMSMDFPKSKRRFSRLTG